MNGHVDSSLDIHGIAHLASDLSFSPNPNDVIPSVLKSIDILLTSATATPSIKRFVLTSSSTAATNPIPNKKFAVTATTWNDAAVKAAWAPAPYAQSRAWDVYGASKTEGEKAVWKFVEEKQPAFEVNTVLPNANFGALLGGKRQMENSTASWITALYGKEEVPGNVKAIPPRKLSLPPE
jgi:nucleoside-diphosphate-sugar epimerase